MTVYEFLDLMGESFNIRKVMAMQNITKDEPVSITTIRNGSEERKAVLDALECEVMTVDMAEGTIYCE